MRSWTTARVGWLPAAAAYVVLAGNAASAQVYWQPERPPLVTAEHETWFQLGEPITCEGYVYYPAGARVFFDGNVMVRSGAYRGIPLYADTTIEPYSRVFVPMSGGLLQPYERRRTGDAAGTTGSRAPSFPVTMAGELSGEPVAEPLMRDTAGSADASPRMADAPPTAPDATIAATRDLVQAGRKPKGLNEVYVTYAGYRWRSSGRAVARSDAAFEVVGRAAGFPVYAARGDGRDPRVIYVPSRPGLLAPYERAGQEPKY